MKKRAEKRRQRIKEKTEAVIEAYRTTGTNTDPNGMYTGLTNEVQAACDGGKIYMSPDSCMPTQDADDL
ncbi:MAG: hypothetical protein IJA55_10820 [Clostridia bacterium]|nr:hypothetical protein [Clostridia bacterium]